MTATQLAPRAELPRRAPQPATEFAKPAEAENPAPEASIAVGGVRAAARRLSLGKLSTRKNVEEHIDRRAQAGRFRNLLSLLPSKPFDYEKGGKHRANVPVSYVVREEEYIPVHRSDDSQHVLKTTDGRVSADLYLKQNSEQLGEEYIGGRHVKHVRDVPLDSDSLADHDLLPGGAHAAPVYEVSAPVRHHDEAA